MSEVFLALRKSSDYNPEYSGAAVYVSQSNPISFPIPSYDTGKCQSFFLHDASKISDYMKSGWSIYRCNGFQLVEEVSIELKLEQEDGWCEPSESPKSDHKCRR